MRFSITEHRKRHREPTFGYFLFSIVKSESKILNFVSFKIIFIVFIKELMSASYLSYLLTQFIHLFYVMKFQWFYNHSRREIDWYMWHGQRRRERLDIKISDNDQNRSFE